MPCFQWGMVALHHGSGFCLPVNFTPLFITSPARLLYSTFQQVRHPLGSGWCAHHSHIHWLGSSPGGSAMRWSSECTGSPSASSSHCPAKGAQITLHSLTYSCGNFQNFPHYLHWMIYWKPSGPPTDDELHIWTPSLQTMSWFDLIPTLLSNISFVHGKEYAYLTNKSPIFSPFLFYISHKWEKQCSLFPCLVGDSQDSSTLFSIRHFWLMAGMFF